MTPFQQDITKIVLDKGLLGFIVALGGYHLNRLLERFRARYAYAHTLSEAKLRAYSELGNAVFRFGVEVLNFSRMVLPGKWPGQGKPEFGNELERQVEIVKEARESAFRVISSNLVFLEAAMQNRLEEFLRGASELLTAVPRQPGKSSQFEAAVDKFQVQTSELQNLLSAELHRNPFG
jgi:hypothetical protein